MRQSVLVAALFLIGGVMQGCAKHEEQTRVFEYLVQRFEPPYKLSLYYVGQSDSAAAAEAIAQAVSQWDTMLARLEEAPPPPFRRDRAWTEAVQRI